MKELYRSDVNQVTVNLITNISQPGLSFYVQKKFERSADFEQEKAIYSNIVTQFG